MSDTSLVFNLVARDQTEQGLSSARERFDTAAAGIGAGVAAALGVGIAANLDMEAANAKLAAQLGVGPAEAAELSKVSASVYANAWGDSVQTVNDAIRGVYNNIGDVSQAEGGLEGVTTKALALAETFDQEVGPTTAAVGQLMRTGLASDAEEAFDLISAGFRTSANKADDFLDTLNEYSVQFKRVGLDGETAIGLIDQAIDAGARDSDQVADAIGQFGELALASSTGVQTAFQSIGLNADEMKAKLQAGGKSGQEALQMTLDALRGTKDETIRLNAATALFGDPGTVMGDALFALDPAGAAASSGMDKAAGSTDKLVETAGSSAAATLESFKRKAMGHLAEITGTFIKFALDNRAVFEPLAYTLMGLATTVLIVKGAIMTYTAIASVVAGANAIINASTWTVIGNWLRMMGIGIMAYLRIAAGAVASALTTAAAWTGSALVSIGTWVLAVIRAALVSAAHFAIMAAKAVAWAAVMAAQWLIAMGPVGWVIAVIVGLVVLIVAKWDAVKKHTLAAWDWVWKKIQGASAGIQTAVQGLGKIPGWVAGYFGRMKDAAVERALALATWMSGLPGRISKSIGSMRDLLVDKGIAVVQGLWSGISSMGTWIKNQIIGWAKDVIPGPIAKALGISSPSKVTKAQGQWIARGLIDGLTGSSKQIKAASYKLADIVRDALAPGKKRSKALDVIGTGTNRLMKLAAQEDALADRLKKANKKVADLIKARDKLAADVKKGVLDAANITQITGTGQVSADSILTNLSDKLAQAKSFAANLAKLRDKGVRGDLIAQIAQAGVEGGSAAAAALANADKGTIAQINSTQSQLVAAAGTAGNVAGNAMYGAGINAGQGIVKGLKKEQKAIEKQMLKIAESMKRAIKQALGIKSPSALMAREVGQFIPPGVVQGMQRTAPQLDAAMRSLVRPELAAPQQPLTAPGMAPLMGAQAGGGTVRVRFDFAGADSEFKRMFRKLVRVDGRGQVQILTG
ncbi:phage tail tape measure protein [Streptomyces cupreus]|uniref:Phage tail tape measure protein n=1 Tax=Streptomyces cupreus TaxID=2759956 RepID=A0A7X1MA75_9ACTN|nr:phage tail tape measure protein [Streptomyces cupreus]MBC2903531.1 phage tail tape measure protein [Streptomyces cupreus]